jgi:hypothetical protein
MSHSSNSFPRTSRKVVHRDRWLMAAAALALMLLALHNKPLSPTDHGSVWRVIVAGIAALYLWRLGALIFDLIFVWHRYIQQDAALQFLRENVKRPSFSPDYDPPSGPNGNGSTADVPPPKPVDAPAPRAVVSSP